MDLQKNCSGIENMKPLPLQSFVKTGYRKNWCFVLHNTSHSPLCLPSAEVSPAARPEEEEGGEVRDGRDDCSAADLYRLVPAALHVPREVCSCHQPTAGCFV